MTAGEDSRHAETRGQVLARLASRFRDENLDSPQVDARLLLAHALGIDRLELHTNPDDMVDPAVLARVEELALRRLAREPVSRIIGERWFYGRPFRVTPATLDPRPETETIIEAAKTVFRERRTEPQRILDIGTGTGCLLLTLLAEFPSAHGIGTDISREALDVAAGNAVALGLGHRAAFRHGSDFTAADGTFDLIVSNPPYIPSAVIATLDSDVRDYDPGPALDGGADGLDMYRRLAASYRSFLPEGCFILEVGKDQTSEVAAIFRSGAAEPDISIFHDLTGIARCVAVSPRRTTTG